MHVLSDSDVLLHKKVNSEVTLSNTEKDDPTLGHPLQLQLMIHIGNNPEVKSNLLVLVSISDSLSQRCRFVPKLDSNCHKTN